jgi:LuxR family maltose regulon positive regulatory protein
MDLAGTASPIASDPGEELLAAAAISLLAQPRLWSGLKLPPATQAGAAQRPWSTYWSARLDPALDPASARAAYAAVLARFDSVHERDGALLALAALIETYYLDETALQPLDGWVGDLQRRLPDDGAWTSAELQAQVMACGLAITLRDQAHPLLARWATQGPALLRQLAPGAVRLKLATFLLQYHIWRGEFGQTGLIVDTLPGLVPDGVLPAEALVWHESVASHARFTGQHERAADAIAAALELLRRHGLQRHAYALHAHGAAIELAAGNAEAAARHLQAMRPVLEEQAQADQTHYWHMHAGWHLLRGDAGQALAAAQMALSNSQEIGGPYRTAAHQCSLGTAWLAHGDAAAALPPLRAALAAAQSIGATLMVFTAGLLLSQALEHSGDQPGADAALRDAMAVGAMQDPVTTSGWWCPDWLAQRMARALHLGIEPAFARRFARRAGLACPDPALSAWPWPLRVYAFGEWRIEQEERPLAAPGGRPQQRPFDLLRALLAHDGQALRVGTALEWLWPESEHDAQRKAFDAALLRLRRLLGDDSLLRLEGGQLLLDRTRVWSDVAALGTLADQAEATTGLAECMQLAQRVLSLVRGPFLPDAESPWAMAARERCRRRFVRTIAHLAQGIETQAPEQAAHLYERALDVDPLAESLHRHLMQLFERGGEHAEALRAWRHCKAMLQLAAGLAPSAETQALARRLGLE